MRRASERDQFHRDRPAPPRVVIERVSPAVDGGKYPVKRALGEEVEVEAVIICDGHDVLKGDLLYRHESDERWHKLPLKLKWNDQWLTRFKTTKLGLYHFKVEAAVDRFGTWQRTLLKRLDAADSIKTDIIIGTRMLESWATHLASDDGAYIAGKARALASFEAGNVNENEIREWLADERLHQIAHDIPDEKSRAESEGELTVLVDPPIAGFSAWYEFFPRSFAPERGRHGTFRDAEGMLAYAADLGFDVVYLPPIHPIGESFRKGKNNALTAEPGDVGSPWAIGGKEGGHKAIHPELGTLEDFKGFVGKAKSLGLEIALDLAFQCSPEHPYVREHPEWFVKRPDGSIQYAENPPKKYQDIYPLDFECDDWQALWLELKSVIVHWIDHGIRIFRVDNPHTKSFRFWGWVIPEVRRDHPDVIFLAEAFTRPFVMGYLAKIGFNQSYTYFTWRNTKHDLTEYLTELTKTDLVEYFRPNFWPNTPDILPENVQTGLRAVFLQRVILAGTLSSNYGIYGPAYELLEHVPKTIGGEEYLHSEKYELKRWDFSRHDSLAPVIKRLNHIRAENPALHQNRTLRFHSIANDALIAYSKTSDDGTNIILTIVNLDPHHTQSGMVDLPLEDFGIEPHETFQVHDLLSDARYLWQGWQNYVELNPHVMPAHIFRIRRRMRKEIDFDYFA